MPLLHIVIVLIVIGVILALFNKFIAPIPPGIMNLIYLVIIVGVLVVLLDFFGVWHLGTHIG
jgi:hypothetical protein